MEYLFLRRKKDEQHFCKAEDIALSCRRSRMDGAVLVTVGCPSGRQPYYKGILYQLEIRRAFLDSSLSLKKLSMMLETNQTYLSNAVNRYFGCHLKELLNRYRVEYAKELLRNGGCPLGEVPSRSGFGSKSPFYLAFVRQTGMTPKRYAARERNLVNLEIENEVLL